MSNKSRSYFIIRCLAYRFVKSVYFKFCFFSLEVLSSYRIILIYRIDLKQHVLCHSCRNHQVCVCVSDFRIKVIELRATCMRDEDKKSNQMQSSHELITYAIQSLDGHIFLILCNIVDVVFLQVLLWRFVVTSNNVST